MESKQLIGRYNLSTIEVGEFVQGKRSAPIVPNHKRVIEAAKESQILIWSWKLLNEVPIYYYDHHLWDGTVLCRIMNVIKPNSIKETPLYGDNIRDFKINIQRFLSAVEAYGVPKEKIFKLQDLLYLQNIPKVTETIFELGKIAEKYGNFKGPHLGDMPYECIDPKTKRRGGMPEGDDIHVAHVDIKMLKNRMALTEEVECSREA